MIGLYGATGMLGRLVTERFDRAGVDVALIGRHPAALDHLDARSSHRKIVAPIDDSAALEQAFEGCRVIVNCAPAEACGDRLVRAALDSGIHYVDAAGEQDHIRGLFERFDDEATRSDVTIVPALGFDYAIGDCLARLAARLHGLVDDVVIAYCIEGTDVSGNSAQAAATTTGGQEVVYREGRWRSVPFEFDRASFEFPAPIGVRQMSRYGSGEVITVPRHTRTRQVRTLITSTSLCPHPALLPVFPYLSPVIGFARRTPLRAVLSFAAGVVATSRAGQTSSLREHDSAPTQGAIPIERDDRRFMVVADVHAADGSLTRAIAKGGNFHLVTAAILAHGAMSLAAGSVVAGVHSPATAFEPEALLDALAPDGVSWTTT